MKAIRQVRGKYPNAAFLIGNGPNLNAGIFPGWKELLAAAADKGKKFKPNGLTNTEVYDMVELHAKDAKTVKARVCSKLALQSSMDISVHRRLMEFARDTNSPVLTTNFDAAFEACIGAKIKHIDAAGFTHFYPWKSYYGFTKHVLPTDGFGIWKIHGDVKYKQSIRLGLTDYMGSVERARKMIHKGSDRLFQGKLMQYWSGHETWLHIWFNMPLIIVGFGFDTDEVFLRWLLIERRRYYNLQKRPMDVWFIGTAPIKPSIKNLMKNIGVQFKMVKDYNALYS